MSRPSLLTQIHDAELTFFAGVFNALSAKVAQTCGFSALWGSGFSMSAAEGVRDANELTWSQQLDILERIVDSCDSTLLFDADSGMGDFNTFRRLCKKLELRRISGICVKDTEFPNTNSLDSRLKTRLMSSSVFCGMLRAAVDARESAEFVIVARIEAFIAGMGLEEAVQRAEAYREAGADAILIHSAANTPEQVLAFRQAWSGLPVLLLPTSYYTTPSRVFRQCGFAGIIWSNHLVRSCVTAMADTARRLRRDESSASVEDKIATLEELFKLQDVDELIRAQRRYRG